MIKLVAAMSLLLTTVAQGQTVISLAKEHRSRSPHTSVFEFEMPNVPDGKQVRLGLDARIDWPKLAGSNPWITVDVNDQRMDASDLVNKPPEFTMLSGMDASWVSGKRWRICYAPDFSDEIRTARLPYAIPDQSAYRFEFDVTPFIKPGRNVVAIQHIKIIAQGSTLVLGDVQVIIDDPLPAAARGGVSPAPTGELSRHVAQNVVPQLRKVFLSANGAIILKDGDHGIFIRSRFSAPNGQWLDHPGNTFRDHELGLDGGPMRRKWQGDQYTVDRAITTARGLIHIADTFTNTTDATIGVIAEYRVHSTTEPQQILLAGRPVYSDQQNSEDPRNPTVFGKWDNIALGLVPEDDIFRVHHRAFANGDVFGLTDRQLGIGPGQSHTLEWSVYPIAGEDADYYDFINAVRQHMGSNYTLPQPITFNSQPDYAAINADDAERWTQQRGILWQISNQTTHADGSLAEGTDLPNATEWCDGVRQWRQRLQSRVPEAKVFVYLHAEICTEPGAAEKYADSKHLKADGSHLTTPYHYPIYMYISTLDNRYGKAMQDVVKFILHDIDADGIYLDEFLPLGEATYAYDTTWDGCTAIINPNTHELTGTRSSAILLQMPWRAWMIDYAREHGKVIIGNTPPMTRSLAQRKVPRFTETNSASFMIYTHLASPWGLGNHTASLPQIVRRNHRFLDFGGLITPYTWPTAPDVPRPLLPELMHPITPVRIDQGMVLGEQRIITNRSGRYAFPGGAAGDVYIFDADGRHVLGMARIENGEAQVRMPSDHTAVIVRE
jgi:hypothetical protein